ncbi:hypothetical protein Trydic_g10465, partial [Trypoxylus dichotomus]
CNIRSYFVKLGQYLRNAGAEHLKTELENVLTMFDIE